MSVVAPVRSLDQRMAALEVANRIRIDRAKMKRALKAGSMSVIDVLAEPEGYAYGMKVEQLLIAVPKIGKVKTMLLMRDCMIASSKTVGGLSPRQRDELIRRLA